MESLILSVANAWGVGASVEDIHDAIISKGWSEDDVFLAIKAGELLYNDRVKHEEEKAQQKPLFRRVP